MARRRARCDRHGPSQRRRAESDGRSAVWGSASPGPWAMRSPCFAFGYDAEPGARPWPRRFPSSCATALTQASVELAKEARARFPMFNKEPVSVRRQFSLRACPQELKGLDPQARHPQFPPAVDRAHRQPSASPSRTTRPNGIEPPFSWTYTRKKSAWPTANAQGVPRRGPRVAPLSPHVSARGAKAGRTIFVTALEISADAHQAMVAAGSRPSSTPASRRP